MTFDLKEPAMNNEEKILEILAQMQEEQKHNKIPVPVQ